MPFPQRAEHKAGAKRETDDEGDIKLGLRKNPNQLFRSRSRVLMQQASISSGSQLRK